MNRSASRTAAPLRLLIAAGQPEQAGAHLDIALAPAQDTGMCFYDAELLRLRAHTNTDLDARRADRETALELARRQGATLFELRAASDDFELRGQPVRGGLADVVSRFPSATAGRNSRRPRPPSSCPTRNSGSAGRGWQWLHRTVARHVVRPSGGRTRGIPGPRWSFGSATVELDRRPQSSCRRRPPLRRGRPTPRGRSGADR